MIASQVLEINFIRDTTVIEVAVRRLREEMDEAFEPSTIPSVRGMGYVLEVTECD